MSSPRKFAEKIALIQQKQAEGDAAFKTIIYEVEAAKQRADRVCPNTISDVPTRKYDRSFQDSNGVRTLDNHHSLHVTQRTDHYNGSEQLLQLPDNPSWRRTHSDPSLCHDVMPTVVSNYHVRLEHENNNQPGDYNLNEVKFDLGPYSSHSPYHTSHMQVQHSLLPAHFQPSNHQYDLNNNNHNYVHDQLNPNYSMQSTTVPPLSQQASGSPTNENNHLSLGLRYSSSNGSSNVLMLPPSQNPRSGRSLPDLRTGNTCQQSPTSFSTVSTSTTTAQQFSRTTSLQQNRDTNLFSLAPQNQLSSSIGPLKQSPIMRRRHSPIGDGKPSSPRRRNSPSPDVSSNVYRVEPSSPQSQSSYSPQNSPRILSSPSTNEMNSFSPQSSSENQQVQPYCTLPNHFDRINLDANNHFPQQQMTSSPQLQSSLTNSTMNNGNSTNYYSHNDFYHSYMNDMSTTYGQSQSSISMNNNTNKKSPTIPDIILTDADSAKLDLASEFDNLMDPTCFSFDTDDLLLTATDLMTDPNIGDDTFRL